MLSKNKIKLIKSLDLKKNRDDLGLFVVEGDKLVTEMISSTIGINYLAATEEWFAKNSLLNISQVYEKTVVNKDELIKASLLKSPQNAICVAEIPQYTFHVSDLSDKLSIALDQVQDPGNLGT